jgi:hypothetical protein
MFPYMPTQRTDRRRRAPLARYANYFEVSHNAFEFLIDFGQFQPEAGSVQMHSRVATGPTHAKLLSSVLQNALVQFEGEHGAIADLQTEEENPLEAIHASLPDFEKRAAQARVAATSAVGRTNRSDSSKKR